jgi:hypothetical protein
MEPILPDLQAALLCDDVRQENNGKFILIGLFDTIMAPQWPLRYPRLFVVTRWCSGSGQFTQRTRFLRPDQKTSVVETRPITFKMDKPEILITNIEAFLNLEFLSAGTHWIEIMIENQMKIRFPLRVAALPSPATPPAETQN